MQNISRQAHTLTKLTIEVEFEELASKIQTGSNRLDLLKKAKETLTKINSIWCPGIVYRWLPIGQNETEPEKYTLIGRNRSVSLDLNHSSNFLTKADYVLVAAYSAGSEIEKETEESTQNKDFLLSFLLDLVGLVVLEKTGNMVKQIAEKKAAELGWGVSPFLSPGSIHGWKLEEQLKLCSILPLNNIHMQIRKDAVLVPFKSLSCLIGIGTEYEAKLVGTPCQVCSRNNTCHMKQL